MGSWVAATLTIVGPGDVPVPTATVYPAHLAAEPFEAQLLGPGLEPRSGGTVELPRYTTSDMRKARRMSRNARALRRRADRSFCGTWSILDPAVDGAVVVAEGFVAIEVQAPPGAQVIVRLEPAEPWVVPMGTDISGCAAHGSLRRSRSEPSLRIPGRPDGEQLVLPFEGDRMHFVVTCPDARHVAVAAPDVPLQVHSSPR